MDQTNKQIIVEQNIALKGPRTSTFKTSKTKAKKLSETIQNAREDDSVTEMKSRTILNSHLLSGLLQPVLISKKLLQTSAD